MTKARNTGFDALTHSKKIREIRTSPARNCEGEIELSDRTKFSESEYGICKRTCHSSDRLSNGSTTMQSHFVTTKPTLADLLARKTSHHLEVDYERDIKVASLK